MTGRIKKVLPIILLLVVTVFTAMMFTACVDADYNVQATKLQDEKYGYTVETVEYTLKPGSVWRVTANKGTGIEAQYVRIIYFGTEDAAIDYYYDEFIAYSLPALEAERPDLAAKLTHERVGKIVLYGTADAVKDALA